MNPKIDYTKFAHRKGGPLPPLMVENSFYMPKSNGQPGRYQKFYKSNSSVLRIAREYAIKRSNS